MSDKQHNAEALRDRLLRKADDDTEFRGRLLAQPKAAIEQELGVKLGSDLEIQVVEETPSRICLVLPVRNPSRDGVELSDGDLAQVAGGTLPGPMPRSVSGFDRVYHAVEAARPVGDWGAPYELTPIQIP